MNRILKAIGVRAARLETADQAAIDKVAANCDDTDEEELALYQTQKSLAQANGLITTEEALTLYAIFGGETASIGQWKARSLAEKITALETIFEIHQKMGR